MRAVIQRVLQASVRCAAIDGEGDERGFTETGRIRQGLVVLLGLEPEDSETEVDVFCEKLLKLRLFPGRTPVDRSIQDIGGALLVVSQFTLGASLRKGNRPGFDRAMRPEEAEPLYEHCLARLRSTGIEVGSGRFGAEMVVDLQNDGPFTLVIHVRSGRVVDL